MKIEKPILNGRTDAENLQILETWASNLVDTLNHTVNNLDENNFVQGKRFVNEETMQEEMQKQYKELRELIVNRTKGG